MNVRIDLSHAPLDGETISFKAPCNASEVSGLIIYYPNEKNQTVSKEFTLNDANGNDIGLLDNIFAEGSIVKVIVDTDANNAFMQNSDTNAYLENKFASITPASIGALPLDERGKAIPSNSDLNDYKTPGKYYSYASSQSQTIKNAPSTNAGFDLIVSIGYYSADTITQIAMAGTNRNVYIRSCHGGAWSDWNAQYSAANKPTAADVGAVSKSGDTMTGTTLGLGDGYGEVTVHASAAILQTRTNKNDSNSRRLLALYNSKARDSVADALQLTDYVDGASTTYKVYHTGNKPTPNDIGAPTLESNGRINGAQACSGIAYVDTATIINVTLRESDIGKTIVIYGSRAATITVPAGLPVGSEFEIVRYGTGTVTITGASGVYLNSVESARTIKNQYGVVSLKRIYSSSDSWLLVGDLG